jgi:hypothetical protein
MRPRLIMLGLVLLIRTFRVNPRPIPLVALGDYKASPVRIHFARRSKKIG